MTDHLDQTRRSLNMAAIHSRNTKPEMTVRSIVHGLGYRYRLHDPKLPGSPDMAFPARHKAIFVNGCYWHRHTGCKRATAPKTHIDFWEAKFASNVARDRKARRTLKRIGWQVLTVWQCEINSPEELTERLNEFLEN